jgi:hypothetical protein
MLPLDAFQLPGLDEAVRQEIENDARDHAVLPKLVTALGAIDLRAKVWSKRHDAQVTLEMLVRTLRGLQAREGHCP